MLARANPLWATLETVLAAQPPTAHGPLDQALRDYILLITILVAFLEATAQQLKPIQPPVVMGLSGILRQEYLAERSADLPSTSKDLYPTLAD